MAKKPPTQTGLLNTVAGKPVSSPATDLTDPDGPPLRMPDPFDPIRTEFMKSRTMRRLRGGRMATILSSMLRRRAGTERTAGTDY